MTLHDIETTTIDGTRQRMSAYKDRVLLIVNVASRCGYTPQYTGLEALHRKYEGRGLSVLGFPCDQFGHQEPGSEKEIQAFCSLTYDVTFPLFAKIEVKGPGAHPLYRYLTSAKRGVLGTSAVKWNFTKFLVDRVGTVLRRYAPTDTPEQIETDLVPLLA
jgi:glutathione peroxidase